jgi:hypothetical protein
MSGLAGPFGYQAGAVGGVMAQQSEVGVITTITQFAGCSVQLTQFAQF